MCKNTIAKQTGYEKIVSWGHEVRNPRKPLGQRQRSLCHNDRLRRGDPSKMPPSHIMKSTSCNIRRNCEIMKNREVGMMFPGNMNSEWIVSPTF